MRLFLDRLFLWSGYLAAICLVSIALTIVAQISGRFIGIAIDSTESAGFFLAGATFFGLAHTFKQGDHIRVTLLTRFARGKFAMFLDLWALGSCSLGLAYASYWALDLVYFSYVFGDISPGLLAIPFWIPRSAMALGLVILTVAFIDEFLRVLKGKTPSYIENSSPLFAGADESDSASVVNPLPGKQ